MLPAYGDFVKTPHRFWYFAGWAAAYMGSMTAPQTCDEEFTSVVWDIPNLHNSPDSFPNNSYSNLVMFIPNLLGVLCAF